MPELESRKKLLIFLSLILIALLIVLAFFLTSYFLGWWKTSLPPGAPDELPALPANSLPPGPNI